MSEFIERAVDFEPLPEDERADSNQGDGRTLEGYAAVFDQDTEINSWEGHFFERMSRGAFRKTLKERTPVLQFDHGHDSRFGNLPIGSFESLKEDKHGLRVQARMFDHAEPIRQAIEAGAVSGMSFRFKVVRDSWTDAKGNAITDRNELMDKLYNPKKGDGPLRRNIKEVKLMEAGPVVFPAYPQTTVGVRSNMTDEDRKRAIEDLTAGFEVTEEDMEMERNLGDILEEHGFTAEDVEEFLRGANPFAKGNDPGGDGGKGKKCPSSCDKAPGDHYPSDHPTPKKKTSSGGEAKPTEKKSDDVTSEAPEAGSDADDERDSETPDAAQAGTSGLTHQARERALFLLNMERND